MALHGYITISKHTPLRVFDYDHTAIGIAIDDALSLHIGPALDGDVAVVASCERLSAAIDEVRSAALARMAEQVKADVPSDTPLGIEDDVAGEAVAS